MKIVLKSGRELYCETGILGLSPELELYEGYDNGPLFFYDDGHPKLTLDEKQEIATIMVTRWLEWGRKT